MIFKAPHKTRKTCKYSIFLGGTIDMGNSENWQEHIENLLGSSFDIFNPRRDEWDNSWKQEKENPMFKEQVEWELEHLEKADFIIMYFAETSKSPISMLELGAFKDKEIYVCCPKGFYRHGNIDIFCEKYNIPLFEKLEDLIKFIVNIHKN